MWMGRFAGPGGLLAVLLAAAQLKAVSGAYAHTRLLLLLLLLRLAVLLPGVALPTPRRRDAATPRRAAPPSFLPAHPSRECSGGFGSCARGSSLWHPFVHHTAASCTLLSQSHSAKGRTHP